MKNLALAVAPHEHVRFADSLVGLAGYLRTRLDAPRTLDELYAELERADERLWPSMPSFERLALAVTLLFALGAVRVTQEDRIEAVR